MERCKNMMVFSIVLLTSTAMYAMDDDETSRSGALSPFKGMPALESPHYAIDEALSTISGEAMEARLEAATSSSTASSPTPIPSIDPAVAAAAIAEQRRYNGALALGSVAALGTIAQRFDPAAILKTVTSGATRGGNKAAYPITKGVIDTCEQLAGPIAGLGVILYFYYEIKEKGRLEHLMKNASSAQHADQAKILELAKGKKHERELFHTHLVQEHNAIQGWHNTIGSLITGNAGIKGNNCRNCATMRSALGTLGADMATRIKSLKELHDDAGIILTATDTAPVAKNVLVRFWNNLVSHKQ